MRDADDAALVVHFESEETDSLLQPLDEQLGVVVNRIIGGGRFTLNSLPDVSHLPVKANKSKRQGKHGEHGRIRQDHLYIAIITVKETTLPCGRPSNGCP